MTPIESPHRHRRLLHVLDILATTGALLVLPVIAIEARATDPRWLTGAAAANWVIWLVFLGDAGANLYALGPRWLRRRSAWLDVAIILASFPLLPDLLASTRALRVARVTRAARATRSARLIRALRIVRLVAVVARGFSGMRRILDPTAFPFVAAAVLLVVVTGGVALFVGESSVENLSLPDAMWWAVTTVTTVGYGDVVPRTPAGRIVAVVVMVVGIAFTSLLTAQVAAYLAEQRQEDSMERLQDDLTRLEHKIDELTEVVRTRAAAGTAELTENGESTRRGGVQSSTKGIP